MIGVVTFHMRARDTADKAMSPLILLSATVLALRAAGL